ncbi:MAG: S-layer homology domain-containing protein [Firmicutes bacterium]|nr:S-layer homology domain-containing protein [Bacillota bacterium]
MSAKRRSVKIVFVLLCVLLLGPATPPLRAALGDARGHWASAAIEALAARGLFEGNPENQFDPEGTITRGEFAEILAEVFAAVPEEAAFAEAPADQPVTRAEAAVMVARLLGVSDLAWFSAGAPAYFDDLSPDHWAYPAAQALKAVGVLPPFVGYRFDPAAQLTRAEAAWLAYQGGRLARENGTITFVDVPTGRITLETEQGRIRDVRAEPDTVIVRHDALESLDGLGAGDRVFIVSDRFGTPKLIVASAESAAAPEDLTERLATLILDVFTVEELQQMIAGDWSVATDGLQREVRERLAAAGITDAESEALLNGDWQSLQQSVVERVQTELTERFSISEELADALLQGDWNAVRERAQLEVAQHVLNLLLANTDNPARA